LTPNIEQRDRAEGLLARARAITLASELVLSAYAWFLRTLGRGQEAAVAARRLIELFPNHVCAYSVLGWCEIEAGHAEEAMSIVRAGIRLNPRYPDLFAAYHRLGTASLMLGRDHDAIEFLERAMALNPEAGDAFRATVYRKLSAAYARGGQVVRARQALAEADHLYPFDTVRSHWPQDPNPVYSAQIKRFQEGLRLAGERDHAEEDADFSVSPDAVLQFPLAGYTPTSLPGATTIRTADLSRDS